MRKDLTPTISDRGLQNSRRSSFFSPWLSDNDPDTWFDNFFGSDMTPFTNDRRFLSPAIDVDETAEEYVVSADLPGIKKEDISIDCAGNQLTILAERKYETHENKKGNRHERFHGTYQRSFSLPQGADTAKIVASYESGVLEVHIPKGEAVKSKRIQIGESKKDPSSKKIATH